MNKSLLYVQIYENIHSSLILIFTIHIQRIRCTHRYKIVMRVFHNRQSTDTLHISKTS